MNEHDENVKMEDGQEGGPSKSTPKMRVIKLTVLILVIGMFGFFTYSFASKGKVVDKGDPAPQFALEDLDGNTANLTDYKGQMVIVNYFATWCGPCKDEAPELEAFDQEYGGQYKLLIIDIAETKDRVKKFIKENNTTSTYLFDFDSKVSKSYGITGQPETFIIDKKGIIREHIKGPISKMELYNLVSQYDK